MNKGVEMLLKRMEGHPEEFPDRWYRHVDMFLNNNEPDEQTFFTDEEREALMTKFAEIERDRFTATIMDELMNNQDWQEKKMEHTETLSEWGQRVGTSTSSTSTYPTVGAGALGMQQAQIAAQQAMVDEQHKAHADLLQRVAQARDDVADAERYTLRRGLDAAKRVLKK